MAAMASSLNFNYQLISRSDNDEQISDQSTVSLVQYISVVKSSRQKVSIFVKYYKLYHARKQKYPITNFKKTITFFKERTNFFN